MPRMAPGLAARLARPPRALARSLALAGLTLVSYVWLLLGYALRRDRAARDRLRRRMVRRWCRRALAIAGLRCEIHGRIPPQAAFLVSNHLSYLDVILLASQVDAVFVARHDLARWPIIGRLARSVGTLFVNRGSLKDTAEATRRMEAARARGDVVVFFPEGGSSGGADVGPFRPALLEPAAASGGPVAWASLHYATAPDEPPAAEAVCWWGPMNLPLHAFRLLGLRGARGRLSFGPEALVDRDRKRLARRLRRGVLEDFRPSMPPEREDEGA